MEPTALESLLTSLTAVVTSIVGIVSKIVAVIIAQPLLLIPVGIGFLGAGVHLFKRIRR